MLNKIIIQKQAGYIIIKIIILGVVYNKIIILLGMLEL
jgi:hypothetical protein